MVPEPDEPAGVVEVGAAGNVKLTETMSQNFYGKVSLFHIYKSQEEWFNQPG